MMPRDQLTVAVAARFFAVNGSHVMTALDDDYVSNWYVTVEQLCDRLDREPDEIRTLMLTNRLPLPSYIRSDGAQMVPRDLDALLDEAGGADQFPRWFAKHFASPEEAVDEWDAYLRGHYVCLRTVTPANIQRKGELVRLIEKALAAQPESDESLACLHALVDELDALEPPFAPYDRLRFGGPVSRDRLITDVRERYRRPREEPPGYPTTHELTRSGEGAKSTTTKA